MKAKVILSIIGILVLTIVLSVFLGCERIDSGHVGLKVNMTGGNQGVSNTEYVTGWVFYPRLFQRVYEFPTYQQHKDYEPYEVPAKGGIIFTVHPTFNYNLNAGEVANMFQRYRVGLKQLEEGYLKTAMTLTIREVTNTFTVDSILNNQAGYDAAILERLNKQLHPYFQVTQFSAQLRPDDQLKLAILNKAKAIQEAQAKNAQIGVSEAAARVAVIDARKDSAVRVIEAQSIAEAMRVKKAEITPIYVDYLKWVDVDPNVPRVPQVVNGGSSSLLYSLKN